MTIYPPRQVYDLSLTKESDYRHTVRWTGDYTTAEEGYPYAAIYIDRWDNVTGHWYLIATLGWWATSYTDRSTQPDREYAYRVQAGNDAGLSPYVYTVSSWTTPARHQVLSWTRPFVDVVLTWGKVTSLPVWTEVQVQAPAGIGTWTHLADVAGNTFTHVDPDGSVDRMYRVRPWIEGVVGEWTTSQLVPAMQAPLPPTTRGPDGNTVDNTADPVVFQWGHNSRDGTTQTAYEVQYRVGTGAWVSTGKLAGAAGSHTFPAGTWPAGETVRWWVRTWGQHATASASSAIAQFTTGSRPSVTITNPGSVFGRSDVTVEWDYHDPEGTGQVRALVELLDANDTSLWTSTVPGAATSVYVPVNLDNNTTYKVKVIARDGSGLNSAPAVVVFTTDFVRPPAPLVQVQFDPDLGCVTVNVDNTNAPLPPDWEPPTHNRVFRSIGGGPFELIADPIPLDAIITDWVPSTAGSNTYRVEAVSGLGTTAATTETVAASSAWCFVNGGPDNTVMARLRGGPAVALATSRTKVLHQFVGLDAPVEFTGSHQTREYSLSGSVDGYGAEEALWGSWRAWDAMAGMPAPLIFRDPMGRREHVSISDVRIDHDATTKKARVTCKLTVVTP